MEITINAVHTAKVVENDQGAAIAMRNTGAKTPRNTKARTSSTFAWNLLCYKNVFYLNYYSKRHFLIAI